MAEQSGDRPETEGIDRRIIDLGPKGAAVRIWNSTGIASDRRNVITDSTKKDIADILLGSPFRYRWGDGAAFKAQVRRVILKHIQFLAPGEELLEFDDRGNFSGVNHEYDSRADVRHDYLERTRESVEGKIPTDIQIIDRAKLLARYLGDKLNDEKTARFTEDRKAFSSALADLIRANPNFFTLNDQPKSRIQSIMIPSVKREHEDSVQEYKNRLKKAVKAFRSIWNTLPVEDFAKFDDSSDWENVIEKMEIDLRETERILQSHDKLSQKDRVLTMPFAYRRQSIPGIFQHGHSLPKKFASIDALTGMYMVCQYPENILASGTPDYVFFGQERKPDPTERLNCFYLTGED